MLPSKIIYRKLKGCLVVIMIFIFAFVIAMTFDVHHVFAANCGDTAGPGGTRVACDCNDFVVTDYTLQASDPIVLNICPVSGLKVGASNITIDCAGNTIHGNGIDNTSTGLDSGISSYNPPATPGFNNITIQNCTVRDYHFGIMVFTTHGTTITNNDTDRRINIGINGASNCNTVTNNTVSSELIKIDNNVPSLSCAGTVVDGNILDQSYIELDSSSNVIVTNNTITSSSPGNFGIVNLVGDGNYFDGNTISNSDFAFLMFATNAYLTNNYLCFSNVVDIYDFFADPTNTGDTNTCDTAIGYADTNASSTGPCYADCSAPPVADADYDGIPDASDNCPNNPNPDQEDYFGLGGHVCQSDTVDQRWNLAATPGGDTFNLATPYLVAATAPDDIMEMYLKRNGGFGGASETAAGPSNHDLVMRLVEFSAGAAIWHHTFYNDVEQASWDLITRNDSWENGAGQRCNTYAGTSFDSTGWHIQCDRAFFSGTDDVVVKYEIVVDAFEVVEAYTAAATIPSKTKLRIRRPTLSGIINEYVIAIPTWSLSGKDQGLLNDDGTNIVGFDEAVKEFGLPESGSIDDLDSATSPATVGVWSHTELRDSIQTEEKPPRSGAAANLCEFTDVSRVGNTVSLEVTCHASDWGFPSNDIPSEYIGFTFAITRDQVAGGPVPSGYTAYIARGMSVNGTEHEFGSGGGGNNVTMIVAKPEAPLTFDGGPVDYDLFPAQSQTAPSGERSVIEYNNSVEANSVAGIVFAGGHQQPTGTLTVQCLRTLGFSGAGGLAFAPGNRCGDTGADPNLSDPVRCDEPGAIENPELTFDTIKVQDCHAGIGMTGIVEGNRIEVNTKERTDCLNQHCRHSGGIAWGTADDEQVQGWSDHPITHEIVATAPMAKHGCSDADGAKGLCDNTYEILHHSGAHSIGTYFRVKSVKAVGDQGAGKLPGTGLALSPGKGSYAIIGSLAATPSQDNPLTYEIKRAKTLTGSYFFPQNSEVKDYDVNIVVGGTVNKKNGRPLSFANTAERIPFSAVGIQNMRSHGVPEENLGIGSGLVFSMFDSTIEDAQLGGVMIPAGVANQTTPALNKAARYAVKHCGFGDTQASVCRAGGLNQGRKIFGDSNVICVKDVNAIVSPNTPACGQSTTVPNLLDPDPDGEVKTTDDAFRFYGIAAGAYKAALYVGTNKDSEQIPNGPLTDLVFSNTMMGTKSPGVVIDDSQFDTESALNALVTAGQGIALSFDAVSFVKPSGVVTDNTTQLIASTTADGSYANQKNQEIHDHKINSLLYVGHSEDGVAPVRLEEFLEDNGIIVSNPASFCEGGVAHAIVQTISAKGVKNAWLRICHDADAAKQSGNDKKFDALIKAGTNIVKSFIDPGAFAVFQTNFQ